MPDRQSTAPSDAQYAALAATSEAQFREIFRRLKDVELTSSEGRDIAREVLTVLREQNAMARIEEVRREVTAQVDALRQDTVHAITEARKHLDAKVVEFDVQFSDMDDKMADLQGLRDRGKGMAQVGRWAVKAFELLIAAGSGGLLISVMRG